MSLESQQSQLPQGSNPRVNTPNRFSVCACLFISYHNFWALSLVVPTEQNLLQRLRHFGSLGRGDMDTERSPVAVHENKVRLMDADCPLLIEHRYSPTGSNRPWILGSLHCDFLVQPLHQNPNLALPLVDHPNSRGTNCTASSDCPLLCALGASVAIQYLVLTTLTLKRHDSSSRL